MNQEYREAISRRRTAGSRGAPAPVIRPAREERAIAHLADVLPKAFVCASFTHRCVRIHRTGDEYEECFRSVHQGPVSAARGFTAATRARTLLMISGAESLLAVFATKAGIAPPGSVWTK